MPSIATMTDPMPIFAPPKPAFGESSSGSSTPSGTRRRRRIKPQPSFHLSIGKVEVPRSLPATRTLGTQTDESALRVQAEEDKKFPRRLYLFFKKHVMPVLRGMVSVLDFFLRRVGFGFRLN